MKQKTLKELKALMHDLRQARKALFDALEMDYEKRDLSKYLNDPTDINIHILLESMSQVSKQLLRMERMFIIAKR